MILATLAQQPSTSNLLQVASQIKTPLMLAGLALIALYLLFKSTITPQKARMVFVIALIAEILGIGSYIIGQVFLPPKKPVVLDGIVYSPKGSIKGLPHATVYLAVPGHPVMTSETQATGYFSFLIKPDEFGEQAQLYVTVAGYQDSGRTVLYLSETMDQANFWLDAYPTVSAAKSLVQNRHVIPYVAGPEHNSQQSQHISLGDIGVCLTGQWKEFTPGQPVMANGWNNLWIIVLNGESLTVTRSDNFAKMDLKRFGPDFKGDLTWGTGDVWHDIALTPAADCKAIKTNLAWKYVR